MTSDYPRDMIGYGANPPDPRWPGNARLAVNFVLNYEEGSEESILDGEQQTETGLTENASVVFPPGMRNLGAESMFEYGSRAGFWRLMRLFSAHDMPVTIYGCALALERNPDAIEAIKTAGHDVCSHGWRWVKHYELDLETERDHIRRAVASIERAFGERPLGWYCRYAPSENTRRLLIEEGGFLYDSDSYADDLPFWTDVDGKAHLIVPYTLTNNDVLFMRGSLATADDYFQYIKDGFDMLYDEGATAPKMMSVGLHNRIIGHPARAVGLARLLDYISGFDDVWVCRRADIARHWIEQHPFQK
ncbi:MAG: polysaccharide deacetylase family protein [Hyphomicrobiaceae bacterium]|nr:polysaccharide deacetylase family protein [Hyphomicrobiaceae bacterium]